MNRVTCNAFNAVTGTIHSGILHCTRVTGFLTYSE